MTEIQKEKRESVLKVQPTWFYIVRLILLSLIGAFLFLVLGLVVSVAIFGEPSRANRAVENEQIILTIIFGLFGLVAPVLFFRKKLRTPIGARNYQLYAGQSKRASLGIMVVGIIITIVGLTLAGYGDAHVIRDVPIYVVSLLSSTGAILAFVGFFAWRLGR
jgi:hypothetical protein